MFDIGRHRAHGVADAPIRRSQSQFGLHRERVVAAVEVGLVRNSERLDDDFGHGAVMRERWRHAAFSCARSHLLP